MQPVGEDDLAAAMRAALAQGHATLLAAIQEAGGPGPWWVAQGLGEPPAGLTEDQLLAETLAFWEWARQRETQCARCPPHGGACAGPTQLFRGRRLGLHADGSKYVAAKCPRWIEHTLRDWLLRSNVDPRSVHFSLDDFETTEATLVQIDAFVEAVSSGTERWLVVSGPHGSGKTHLTVGLIREIKRRSLHRECWYTNFLSVPRELKVFYANEREADDPLERVRECPLLFLENLPATLPGWLQSAVEEALAVRWQQQLPTVLTSLAPATAVLHSLPALTGFGAVPSIQLVKR